MKSQNNRFFLLFLLDDRRMEVQGQPVHCPSLILFERDTPDLQRTPELHAGGAEAAGGQD